MRKFYSIYKFHIAIFVFSFLAFAKFNFDTDLGLHLAYGEWFFNKGEILRYDPFTWTLPGYKWVHSYFLFQLLAAYLIDNAGFILTVLVFSLIPTLGVVMLLQKKLSWIQTYAISVGVILASAYGGIRPHILDFFLFCLVLVCLKRRLFENKYFVPVWFLIFLVWVNFHGGYLVGFLSLAGFVFIDTLGRYMNGKRVQWRAVGFTIAAAWVGTQITPFGQNLGHSLSDYLNYDVWLNIKEFQPLVISQFFNLLVIISGLLFILLLKKTDLGRELPWMCLGLTLYILPFVLGFITIFWAAYFIFVCSFYFKFKFRWSFWGLVPVGLGGVAVFVIYAANFWLTIKPLDEVIQSRYPVKALAFIAQNGLGQGLLNELAWGGFIDWRYPEIKVFIDGRNGWKLPDGKTHLGEYLSLTRGNCKLLEKYDVQTVLMESSFKNECFSGWREVYRDTQAIVLVKPQ